MRPMTPEAGTAAAMALAPPPTTLERPALFLDLDGVLAPLAPTPDAVGPDPRRSAVLKALERRLDGRLAIVSGRTIAEVDRISDRSAASVSGVHGLERRRRDGSIDRAAPAAGVAQALAALKAFAATRPGLVVEDKGVSAGLHYRQAPEREAESWALAKDLAWRTGLSLQPGALVVELKTPGADKGTAIRAFMAEAPFRGATPIMLGDDLTDEHGFEAAAALGGFGVLVGPERPTAARHRLQDVAAVLDWLEAVAQR